MQCPGCTVEQKCRVTDTRTPQGARIRWLMDLQKEWPDLLVRRRRCPEHGTFVTVELPLSDLKSIVEHECLSVA
jgi:hypothetical protein